MKDYDKAWYEHGFKGEIMISEMDENKTYIELAKVLTRKYISTSSEVRMIKRKFNYENDTFNITVYFSNNFVEKFFNIKY